MKKCPVCEKTLASFDDIVRINDQFYHEDCIEIVPAKYRAYIPGEGGEGYIGEFTEDDKSWSSDLLEDGEYLEELLFRIVYKDFEGIERERRIYAIDDKVAAEKHKEHFSLEIIKIELVD